METTTTYTVLVLFKAEPSAVNMIFCFVTMGIFTQNMLSVNNDLLFLCETLQDTTEDKMRLWTYILIATKGNNG